MKKTTIYLLLALASIGILSLGAAAAFGTQFQNREQITQALEDGDYNAWKTAMQS
jgi:hypothetical protein